MHVFLELQRWQHHLHIAEPRAIETKCFTLVLKTKMQLCLAAKHFGVRLSSERNWQRLREATGSPQLAVQLALLKVRTQSTRFLDTMVTWDNKHRFEGGNGDEWRLIPKRPRDRSKTKIGWGGGKHLFWPRDTRWWKAWRKVENSVVNSALGRQTPLFTWPQFS